MSQPPGRNVVIHTDDSLGAWAPVLVSTTTEETGSGAAMVSVTQYV